LGVDPLAQRRDRLLEREWSIAWSGLVEQLGEAVQGVGDGLGLGGVDQLGYGGEVDVLVPEADRVPASRTGGLLLARWAQRARGRDAGAGCGEHALRGRRRPRR